MADVFYGSLCQIQCSCRYPGGDSRGEGTSHRGERQPQPRNPDAPHHRSPSWLGGQLSLHTQFHQPLRHLRSFAVDSRHLQLFQPELRPVPPTDTGNQPSGSQWSHIRPTDGPTTLRIVLFGGNSHPRGSSFGTLHLSGILPVAVDRDFASPSGILVCTLRIRHNRGGSPLGLGTVLAPGSGLHLAFFQTTEGATGLQADSGYTATLRKYRLHRCLPCCDAANELCASKRLRAELQKPHPALRLPGL